MIQKFRGGLSLREAIEVCVEADRIAAFVSRGEVGPFPGIKVNLE